MPSQFFGLNIAYSALLHATAGQNTTANNLANEETEGYSRQTVVTKAKDPLRTFAKYGCAGAGVDTLAIERMHDIYYDERYRTNNANVGTYEVKASYMKLMELYFADDDYTIGFNTIFGYIFDALQENRKNAGDTTFKQALVKECNSLTDYFNSMAGSLREMQKDINAQIKSTTDQINALATEIATINKQINIEELSGSNANQLRDQRDKLLDELSKLVDVEVTETPVYDTNNPDRETGATRCLVRIAGGQTLVDGNEYHTLICQARQNTERVNQSDINGLFDIYWSNGNKFDLTNASLGGTLRGLIDMRDGNNNEFFHGTITELGMERDDAGTNHQTVTVEVDAEYLKDLNKSNLAEYGRIQLGTQVVYYDSFSFSYDETTGKYSYTFVLSDTTKNPEAVGSSKIGQDASVGTANSYQGIPYYMQQMTEWIRNFAEAFNGILTQDGAIDSNGDPATNLFVVNGTGTDQFDCTGTPDKSGSYTIKSTDNTYYKMTAETFGISSWIERNASRLATRTIYSDGDDKYDIVEQLIDLQTNKSMMSFRGCSASEFLQCIMADIALNANSANTMSEKYKDLSNHIDTLRMSVSSVDKDEEGANLVKYQNAFELASRLINTFSQMYNRLILETGV